MTQIFIKMFIFPEKLSLSNFHLSISCQENDNIFWNDDEINELSTNKQLQKNDANPIIKTHRYCSSLIFISGYNLLYNLRIY